MIRFRSIPFIIYILFIQSCSKIEVTEKFKDGKVKEECQFNGPYKNGICKGFFNNGDLEYLVNFKNDTLHGLSKFFHENGSIHWEVIFEKGKKNGEVKYYDKEGNIYQVSTFKENQLTGNSFSYYSNGNLKTKMTYTNGLLHGFYYSYFENGQKEIISKWEKGEQIEFCEYNEEGKLINHLIKYDLIRKDGQLIIKVTNQRFDFVGLRQGILNSNGDFELQRKYFSENGIFVVEIPDEDFSKDAYYFTLFEVEAFENDPDEGTIKSKVEFQYYLEKDK
ncbi:toxin-antitoxin system YwqK family antitoxin [Belliella kenyensis]|uniref:Toxin-antitoxin system YwqK family antitoxin n=1 Tax=Belliella kenyensis TaxID=1472724 RepID=A0ABV8EQJ6_9BACT|nr:hypothetical protein [Belliella kenyensis]MCH7403873.1 hypothetical protein [Belliella kenyensis]MDN3604897.1 hypothetical protein [Belliella kenyensis]